MMPQKWAVKIQRPWVFTRYLKSSNLHLPILLLCTSILIPFPALQEYSFKHLQKNLSFYLSPLLLPQGNLKKNPFNPNSWRIRRTTMAGLSTEQTKTKVKKLLRGYIRLRLSPFLLLFTIFVQNSNSQ